MLSITKLFIASAPPQLPKLDLPIFLVLRSLPRRFLKGASLYPPFPLYSSSSRTTKHTFATLHDLKHRENTGKPKRKEKQDTIILHVRKLRGKQRSSYKKGSLHAYGGNKKSLRRVCGSLGEPFPDSLVHAPGDRFIDRRNNERDDS